jgi:hypothetical protein
MDPGSMALKVASSLMLTGVKAIAKSERGKFVIKVRNKIYII